MSINKKIFVYITLLLILICSVLAIPNWFEWMGTGYRGWDSSLLGDLMASQQITSGNVDWETCSLSGGSYTYVRQVMTYQDELSGNNFVVVLGDGNKIDIFNATDCGFIDSEAIDWWATGALTGASSSGFIFNWDNDNFIDIILLGQTGSGTTRQVNLVSYELSQAGELALNKNVSITDGMLYSGTSGIYCDAITLGADACFFIYDLYRPSEADYLRNGITFYMDNDSYRNATGTGGATIYWEYDSTSGNSVMKDATILDGFVNGQTTMDLDDDGYANLVYTIPDGNDMKVANFDFNDNTIATITIDTTWTAGAYWGSQLSPCSIAQYGASGTTGEIFCAVSGHTGTVPSGDPAFIAEFTDNTGATIKSFPANKSAFMKRHSNWIVADIDGDTLDDACLAGGTKYDEYTMAGDSHIVCWDGGDNSLMLNCSIPQWNTENRIGLSAIDYSPDYSGMEFITPMGIYAKTSTTGCERIYIFSGLSTSSTGAFIPTDVDGDELVDLIYFTSNSNTVKLFKTSGDTEGGYKGSEGCQYPCIWYEPFDYGTSLSSNDWYLYPVNNTLTPKGGKAVINGTYFQYLRHYFPQVTEGIATVKFNLSHQIDQPYTATNIFTRIKVQKYVDTPVDIVNLRFEDNNIDYIRDYNNIESICTNCYSNNTEYRYTLQIFIKQPDIQYYSTSDDDYKYYDKNTWRIYQNGVLLNGNLGFDEINFTTTDLWYLNRFEVAKYVNYTIVLDEIKVFAGTTELYLDLNETISDVYIVTNETICFGAFCQTGEEESPIIDCNVCPECCVSGVASPIKAVKFTLNYMLISLGVWIKANWFYFVLIVFGIVLLIPLYIGLKKKIRGED